MPEIETGRTMRWEPGDTNPLLRNYEGACALAAGALKF